MNEVTAHALGDYCLQSDWMATEKTEHSLPALAHAAAYTACFLPITRDRRALFVIGATHLVIDRFRLAKYVVWAKNQAAPKGWRHPWDDHVSATGYHAHDELGWRRGDGVAEDCERQDKNDWLAVWLMIFADNAIHLALNGWAIRRWG